MSISSVNQRTLKSPVSCSGVGLHSGKTVSMRLIPSPVKTGLVFVRTDLSPQVVIPARSEFVVDTSLATTLGKGQAKVSTVEHLVSALVGLGIDNLRIELDGPEVPIMDGSAAPFTQLILEAGIRVQDEPKSFLVMKKPVSVVDGDKEASLSPSNGFSIDCTIDFRHPLISDQTVSFDLGESTYAREVSKARTFGFLKDVEKLQQVGLALGGSLQNAIVVDEFSILNPEGLRFPNEFVRHKVLDAIGDLALLGHPVIGHLTCFKSGHGLHHKLAQKVMSDASSYVLVRAHQGDMERLNLRLPELAGALEPVVA